MIASSLRLRKFLSRVVRWIRPFGFVCAGGVVLGLVVANAPASAAVAEPATPSAATALEKYLAATRQRLCPVSLEPLTLDETDQVMSEARDMLSFGDVEGVTLRLCQVIETRSRVLGPTKPRTLAVFNNLAMVLRTQGRAAEGRDLLENLLPVFSAYPPQHRFVAVSALHNLGTTLYVQGYLVEAERAYRAALSSAPGGENGPGPEQAPTLTNLAFVLEAQGRYAAAEIEHRRAFELRRDAGMALEAAASLGNLGSNLTAQGELAAAEPMLREALRHRVALVGPENLNVGFSLAGLANNLSLQGRWADAVPFAEALVSLRRAALGDAHPETASGFQLLAGIYLEAGEPKQAVEYARLALASRLPETLREEAALSDDARSIRRRIPGATALTFARAAWSASEGQSRSWSHGQVPSLVAEAFVAGQRIPASGTADALARAGGRRAAEGEGEGELARRLEAQLDARGLLDKTLAEAVASRPAAVASLQAKRVQAEADIKSTEAELRRRFPDFFAYVRPEPIGIGAFSAPGALLRADEVLFLMTPGAGTTRGLVWAVTREGAAWAEIPLDPADMEAKIKRFRYLLDLNAGRRTDTPARLDAREDFDWDGSRQLYDALFGSPGVAALARDKSRWILAPQGMLLSVPYAALATRPPAERIGAGALREASWLGMERVLALTPSVASLVTLRGKSLQGTRASRPFFGVGNPAFSGRAEVVPKAAAAYFSGRLGDVAELRKLAALPGTELEITTLAQTLRASRKDYLLGPEATEARIKRLNSSGALSDVRVVAFATHGLVSGDLRNTLAEPALALTPPGVPDAVDDGLLTASEASELRLNAEWVLLSACNTAAGDRPNGEGLSGLARAFLLAGARSLLVSHWRVPDDVAARLTTRAIAITSEQPALGRAAALRESMRELVADRSRDGTTAPFSHPGTWAAFVYVGVD